MDTASGLELPETGRVAGIAFDFPVGDPSTPSGSPPAKVPRRLRRRLYECRSGPSTVEEIEAKLKEADLRRQQFHEWLSRKARPKPRSPSWSSQEEDLGQRLEAKLHLAEQKRLSLLTKAQMRLARLDELRQAAKTGVEMRFEKEREELGTRVESRVQQAEANRMLLLKAHMQRRAAAQERTAQSLLQRINRENNYKELVQTAIYRKRAAAEKKRLGILEAEKTRARTRFMQVRRVAKSVCHQREIERRRMKEQLEDRLQRAKRKRAEYLRQRGSVHSSARFSCNKMHKHGDFLSRKLARCWRRFVRSRRTTFALAKAYETLEINENFVRSMPFEQLAVHIESATTLQTVKALLERLESRFVVSQSSLISSPENIDHLLKRLASPIRRVSSGKGTRTRGQTKRVPSRECRSHETKMSRYPVRVVLCAYMILVHPDAVFSGQGEHETALVDSAAKFIRDFELLVKIILDGSNTACTSRQSSPEATSDDWNDHRELSQLPSKRNFRSQLAAFDAAWRSYLYHFVVWKVKDASSLAEDLVRAACQLELSMMQTCKITPEGQNPDLSHDMRAIQKQVTEDQRLLREKVQHLSGNAGIERMESALSDTRSKFFEAKESGSPFVAPVAHISSPLMPKFPSVSLGSDIREQASIVNGGRSSSVVRSLFQDDASSPVKVGSNIPNKDIQPIPPLDNHIVMENELLVNEIIHENRRAFVDSFGTNDEDERGIKAKIKETMEKAFWDGIMDSLKKDWPDYGRIVELVKELRDELCGMAPQTWKQEIVDSIDVDILSQVLESGIIDMDYLGRTLEYALATLQKLSAPANEEEMKNTHIKLLSELADIAQSNGKLSSSFVIALVKGLRFVLEEIQVLKKEISKARIRMMEPILKGPAGMEYLRKAFADHYGPPSEAANSLPLTAMWYSSTQEIMEEWYEHSDSFSTMSTSQVLPPVTALRSGGNIPLSSTHSVSSSRPSTSPAIGGEIPACKGERVDILVRLGLLKLASGIEGLTQETLPETFKLNLSKLRTVQGHLQKMIVVSTSILVLRQIILSENTSSWSVDVETIISDSTKRLCDLLENVPEVGITEIIETIIESSPDEKLQSKKEVMAGMLVKSLRAGDPVFARVYRSVYLAARAIVLGGTGDSGQRMADATLRRIGASKLLDQVVEIAEVLIVMATVTVQVHRPWYECLMQS